MSRERDDPAVPARPEPEEWAAPWLQAERQALWRRHSDAINAALAERWLEGRPAALLKTDLFDEAVGAGVYATLAARAGRVVGIDVSRAIVEAARGRHPGLIAVEADVRALPFADAAFDAVFSNSTLDHFDRPDELLVALRECARVLRPGGQLVVTLDNPWNPVVALSKSLPRETLNRVWARSRLVMGAGLLPYHVGATLDVRRLREALASVGLEVRGTAAIVHAPRVLAVLAAQLLEQRGTAAARERFLRLLARMELLSALPTRYLTGHFVCARARKPRARDEAGMERWRS
jgi:SAM-dependent methyltransferase